MPRHKNKKQITTLPDFMGYKPVGIHSAQSEHIDLLFEEYQAIDLVDYRNMNFEQAAQEMKISKTSFARLISSARKKVAAAFVQCKALKAVPGDSYSDYNWYRCKHCFFVAKSKKSHLLNECPSCQSHNLTNIFEQ